MITERTKAIAKARLRQNISAEDIAEELEIPLKLVEEWAGKLSPTDMVVQESVALAVNKIQTKALSGEVMPMMEEVLKETLIETAIDLTKSMALPALQGDMVHAKTIQLLADAIVRMYQIIILKGGNGSTGPGGATANNEVLDSFAEMMRD